MRTISKTDIERLDDAKAVATAMVEVIAEAIQRANEAIAEANSLIEDYNDALSGIAAIVEDIASEIEAYMDERSDAWREGDKGEQYESWLQAVQGAQAEIEGLQIDAFDEVEGPDLDSLEATLDGLPKSADEA